MHARVRRAARFILTLLLIGSLSWSAFNLWTIWTDPLVHVWTDRAADRIAARLEAELHRAGASDAIVERLRDLLAAEPRDWARIDALADLADEMEMALPEDLRSDLDAARAEDSGFFATTQKCVLCMWNVANCDLSSALYCRVAIDLTPLGDIASVARESGHIAPGSEVDEVDLALSGVGLASVALVPLTGGSSLTVKAGAGILKTGYRIGAVSAELLAKARRIAGRAIDWDALRRGAAVDFVRNAERYIRPEALAPLARMASHGSEMRDAVGLPRALLILRSASSEADVRRLAAVTKAAPRKTAGALEILGKNRLMRTAIRLSDEVWQAIRGLMGVVASFILLVASTLKTVSLRALRRAAR